MLTTQQEQNIIKETINAFKNQKGISLDYNDFSLKVEKPNDTSLCSFLITSNRRDDNFKIKLYLKGFSSYTGIGNLYLTQEQNYSTGLNDDMFVSDINLEKTDHKAFHAYLLSSKFTSDVVNNVSSIISETSGFILMENGSKILMEG